MEEHRRALLQRFQYSEQFREKAALRVVFKGEILSRVMADSDIHNSYSLRNSYLLAEAAFFGSM